MIIQKLIYKYLQRQLASKWAPRLASDPLNPVLYNKYAKLAFRVKEFNLAYSVLKCGKYIDSNSMNLDLFRTVQQRLEPLEILDVNQYQRFNVLQECFKMRMGAADSILDVGGGRGLLSRFLPDNPYFLAEPSVNGINSSNLPFGHDSFDSVITCHVLEHIDQSDRFCFIQNLITIARKYVFIFNPFTHKKLDDGVRNALFYEITGAAWAKEHLECGLPDLTEIKGYLKKLGYEYEIIPFGDVYASVAAAYMTYFGQYFRKKLIKVNAHLNTAYSQLETSDYPTNYLVIVKL